MPRYRYAPLDETAAEVIARLAEVYPRNLIGITHIVHGAAGENGEAMNAFLSGGIAVGALAVGLFFFHYWRTSRDRFFLFFMASFWIEAANRFHMTLTQAWREDAPVHYLIRLVSYLLILVAIADKNRGRRN